MSPGPVIEKSPPPGSLRGLAGTDEAGLQLLFEPIRVAPDVDGNRVMQDPVEDRGRNNPVAEDLTPAAEALVGREDHRAPLVAAADELEEEVGADAIDRQVADFVDDHQPRHGVELEPLVEPILADRPAQRRDHARGGREEHAVAPLDRFEAEPDGEMGFADAGRPEQDDILPVLDEVTGGEGLDLLLVEALLQDATTQETAYADFLDLVLTEELASKTAKHVTMRTRLARFPFVKSLETFDFSYQPSLDKKQLRPRMVAGRAPALITDAPLPGRMQVPKLAKA